jgi:hypothetical protein
MGRARVLGEVKDENAKRTKDSICYNYTMHALYQCCKTMGFALWYEGGSM